MASRSTAIFGRLVDSLTAWLRHRRDVGEISRLSPGELVSIANDLHLSPTDLESLAARGAGHAENLDRLLARLGIERAMVARCEPAVMRDMQRVCAACPHTARCRRELRAGTADRTYRKFCANSGTLDGLDREGALRFGGRSVTLEAAS